MSTQEQVANIIIPIGKALGVLACVSAGSERLTVGAEKSEYGAGQLEDGASDGEEKFQASENAYNQSLDAGLFAPDIFPKRKYEVYTLTGLSGALLVTGTILKNINLKVDELPLRNTVQNKRR